MDLYGRFYSQRDQVHDKRHDGEENEGHTLLFGKILIEQYDQKGEYRAPKEKRNVVQSRPGFQIQPKRSENRKEPIGVAREFHIQIGAVEQDPRRHMPQVNRDRQAEQQLVFRCLFGDFRVERCVQPGKQTGFGFVLHKNILLFDAQREKILTIRRGHRPAAVLCAQAPKC